MPDDQIKCIVLNINEDALIMPNASVAEIVPIKNIINVANKPGWMLGYLDWRGNSVPLISFEAMGGVRMPSLAGGTVKAAVLFSIGDDKSIPYVSVLVQGAPTVINVKADDILESEDQVAHPAIEEKVLIDDASYSIMDLEKLESLVKDVLTH
ncbi:MAG TPA: chemotaxis protein CheW [Gammaproteobacteria bacterium]|nr:chemotaxis protein CheW [Gammaproteobacteria bacterium]